ncbi:N-acetylglucosamine-6-phosphate deacetylase [Deinococcus cellulosilyticus]|uniref:N-acetylglucosamine-6-phosphate deacetylase n=1 Tax=Deinococcus cellulosilyticus (strain DSM 18568 / NBRC 106333 / KACC 11606 / 5516J-15) TaxID=1223518 RepID=A0A511N5D4_DEIC1|nr:N-acetylglucosamine-6-phosphate deacetylase [Deinococcus cellulosilyticus]GEM48044.1 N-acetylglucosamine-6-phosphate deacetylase [Deinococcus cellulosilyticus NBRC 106333 = KACC 11606]
MQIQGRVLTPTGFQNARIVFSDRIEELRPVQESKNIILPGFIDVHNHGGAGGDTMDGLEGLQKMRMFHAQHGTTSILATTITNPWENIVSALKAVKEAQGIRHGADLPGVHLEGPFISSGRLGAQPPFAISPTKELLDEILALDVIRLTTVAPEIEGVIESLPQLIQAGVRISIGHTRASFDQVMDFIKTAQGLGGTVAATHVYNAMGGLTGRDPSILGAVLISRSIYGELILDLHHVHPGSFELARQMKPGKLMLITDAMRAAGLGDGVSDLGGQTVYVKDNKASLADGTIAGSLLTLDQALRNAVSLGVPLEEASRMLSATPAEYLGLYDRGSISLGKRADFVVLDDNLQVIDTIVGGRSIHE